MTSLNPKFEDDHAFLIAILCAIALVSIFAGKILLTIGHTFPW